MESGKLRVDAFKILGFADVEPIIGIDFYRADDMSLSLLQIEVDDAISLPGEFLEK